MDTVEEAWEAAFDAPGTKVDLGDMVACDGCGKDFTRSAESGGIMYLRKAYGPCCGRKIERLAIKYDETEYITGRCPEGSSYADWVRKDLRTPGTNHVRVSRF